MTHPFTQYAAAGFLPYLLPIIPPAARLSADTRLTPGQLGKVPGVKLTDGTWRGIANWASREPATLDDAARYQAAGAGVGIRTGDLIAFDIDVMSALFAGNLEALITGIAGPAPCRFGRAPKRLLVYRVTAPLPKWSISFRLEGDHKHKVEMLGRGQQFVAEGLHPVTGKPYEWRDGRNLAAVSWDGLTVLTPDQVKAVQEALAGHIDLLADVVDAGSSAGTAERRPIGDGALMGDPDQLRGALAVLPNDLDYDGWIAMTAAIKAACGGDEAFYPVYEDWALRYPGNTPEQARDKWDSIHDSAVGADYVLSRAADYGFTEGLGFPPIEVGAEEEGRETPRRQAPTPRQLPEAFNPAAIPLRRWVLGDRFLRGAVTAGVGAPGVSKSTFSLLSALAIATGRSDLTGEPVHVQGAVWVHNNEDDEDEMMRRIAGLCLHYGIDFAEIRPRFLFSSGITHRLSVAAKDGDTMRARKACEEIAETCRERGIVFLAADPLVSTHDGGDENSNDDMEKVAAAYRWIAARADIAIDLVHHTVKNHSGNTESRAGDMNAARGAGALIGAVRIAYTLSPMAEKTAEDTGVPLDRAARLVRLDKAKGNYSARRFEPVWFELVSQSLGNGPVDLLDIDDQGSDTVGVPVRVDVGALKPKKDAGAQAMTAEQRRVLEAIVDVVGGGMNYGLLGLSACKKDISRKLGYKPTSTTAPTKVSELARDEPWRLHVGDTTYRVRVKKMGDADTAPIQLQVEKEDAFQPVQLPAPEKPENEA